MFRLVLYWCLVSAAMILYSGAFCKMGYLCILMSILDRCDEIFSYNNLMILFLLSLLPYCSPYGSRCRDLHSSIVKGPNESWLPIMDKAEFRSKVQSQLYVEQFHHERVNNVHNAQQPFRESIERIVHQVNAWKPTSSLYASIISAKNKIEIAIQMRKSGQRGYSYKTRKLLGDMPCQILQARDFYIDPTSDELCLEDDGRMEKVTAHEIVFGPSGEDYKFKKAKGIPTRALWFNVPASALTDAMTTSKRQTLSGHHKPVSAYWPILRPIELNTFLLDDLYNMESEVLSFTLDQMKWHGYIRDNIGYYEIMRKIDMLQALVQRWTWPVSSDSVTHMSPGTIEPAVDTLYRVASHSENLAIKQIWSSFVQAMSNDATCGESRMISSFTMPPTKGGKLVPYLSSDIEEDEVSDVMSISRSERCWRSLLLPNTDSNKCNDWELIREEVGNVY